MARRKDVARREAEQEARRRRNAAAHRSLRARAKRGKGAHALSPESTEPATSSADTPAVTAPADDAQVDAPHVPEHVERTPTDQLKPPAWLAAGAVALDADGDEYVPRVELAPRPGDPDYVDPDAEAADGDSLGEAPADQAVPTLEPDDDPAPGPEDEPEPELAVVPEPDGDPVPTLEPDDSPEDDEVAVAPGFVEEQADADAPQASAASEDPAPPAEAMGADSAPQPDSGDTVVMPAAVAFGTASEPPDSARASAQSDGSDEPPRRRRPWVAVPLVLVILGVLYVGAQALLSGTVPRDTETLGVAIGGMSTQQATGEVAERGDTVAAEDLTMRAAEQEYVIAASEAGLGIDAEATVAQVTGFTVMPDRLWMHIVGGGHLEPVTVIDEQALDGAVQTAAVQMDGAAIDAGVAIEGTTATAIPGRSEIVIDQPESVALVESAWPNSADVELVADVRAPAITDEDAQAFALELQAVTFAAPITLTGEDAEATVDPATLASVSTVESTPSGLALVVDGQTLADEIIASNPDLTTDGRNASVEFDDDHEIVIDEGAPGITIDGAALGVNVAAAVQSPTRTADLPYTAAEPEISAEDLGLADFTEIISSFDTPLTPEPVRTQNLRTAAADVEGVILQPGDSFDLTEVLSPINEAEGYQPAHVIVNGILTTGMGGGLSQMATTAYNVGYFAGYDLIDHRPHSVWFTRYPAGRESTIYTGSINVVFENNTPYAAVFNSYIDGNRLHVDIWSTPHFEVTTAASPKSNVKQPGVKEVDSPNCEAKGPGQPGFTITNTRKVYLDDALVDENSDTWTYQPDDAIRCVSDDDD